MLQRRTLVAVHAHPDDEALLTAGTMARAAAQGHRVVLVVCTDGALGEAEASFGDAAALAAARRAETARSCHALRVDRLVWLGHADSGHGDVVWPDPPGQRRFVRVPVAEAAAAVAQILREERADVVLGYDRHGGYGHPDHVHVHEVVALAAAQTGTRVLEATVPRDLLVGAIGVLQRLRVWPKRYDPTPLRSAYASSTEITHRIDVRRHLKAKRASMRAHTSQATSRDGGPRTLGALLAVPYPLAWWWLGHEWFIDPSLSSDPNLSSQPSLPRSAAPTPRRRDIFEDLA